MDKDFQLEYFIHQGLLRFLSVPFIFLSSVVGMLNIYSSLLPTVPLVRVGQNVTYLQELIKLNLPVLVEVHLIEDVV